MTSILPSRTLHQIFLLLAATTCMAVSAGDLQAAAPDGWIELFDGRSLDGWRASENADTWRVEEGCMVTAGPRSHLFYSGDVGKHDFRNFELEAELRTGQFANSGIYVHTEYQASGWPKKGFEIQVCNAHRQSPRYNELKRTGSLYGVRNLYKSAADDGQWFRVRIRVVAPRICVWVNGFPTVDLLRSNKASAAGGPFQKTLSHGTIALQAHDPGSRVEYRSVRIRPLPDDAGPDALPRAPAEGYGLTAADMDRLHRATIPLIDYHVHLRGGMTVEKAMDRQAVSGINVGVLRNIGQGWPIETDAQLRDFLDGVQGRPVFVGLQVNDRDWSQKHSAKLLARLDFVLGDTMIMPMPNDSSPPVKLWKTDQYKIDDPEAWMQRYVRHNLRVLSEPITILANPTYLPPPVADQYDRLWTDERMRQVIQAAIKNHVALEINARSGLPHERFIRMAKKMGARFTFGSNNFDDRPIDMSRCAEAVARYGLNTKDFYVPVPKQ